MGIKLIIEVMQHAPEALSAKELYAATVFAENANDGSRLIWSSIEDPEFLLRLRVKRARLYELVDALVLKNVLEQVSVGHRHGRARYRFASFTRYSQVPQCPEDPDTDSKCPEEPDTETPQCPEDPDTENDESVRETQTQNHDQCPEDPDISVRVLRTPTPPFSSSQEPPPSSGSRAANPATPEEGGGTASAGKTNPAADAVLDRIEFGRPLRRNERERMACLVADALGIGWTHEGLLTVVGDGWQGARDRIAVAMMRLRDLGDPPAAAARAAPNIPARTAANCPWCDPFGWYETPDGRELPCRHPDQPPAGHPANHSRSAA